MLLAAVVAAMVVLADRVISTWADGHLLLAWVFLWVVVFAGMALFADTARSLARRAVVSLDGWSQALAEARAETRMWEMARMDHRLMNELMAARTQAEEADEEPVQAFAEALAPLGGQLDLAFIYGSVARGQDTSASDVDLLLVSETLGYADVMAALHPAIERLGRQVNPTIYTRDELARRIREGNAFVTKLLAQPKLWLIGGEHDLGA